MRAIAIRSQASWTIADKYILYALSLFASIAQSYANSKNIVGSGMYKLCSCLPISLPCSQPLPGVISSQGSGTSGLSTRELGYLIVLAVPAPQVNPAVAMEKKMSLAGNGRFLYMGST